MTEQRTCRDCQQTFAPEGSAVTCHSCVQDYIDSQMFGADEECGQCGGEGYIFDCFDGCCLHADEGCDLCTHRCDWCNQPTSKEAEARAQLGQALVETLSKQKTETGEVPA